MAKKTELYLQRLLFDFGNPSNYITRIETGYGHTVKLLTIQVKYGLRKK